MKRIERPANDYDEQLLPLDEQICALLKKRKELANHPGSPSDEMIATWAAKYGLFEEYLQALFGTMRMEKFFKTRVEPSGFRKYLQVVKSVEVDERIYSLTVIRQYENASVIQLHIDWDEIEEVPFQGHHNHHFELTIGEGYDCRMDRGGGSTGHYTYNFVVSPPVPDDIAGLELVFKEFSDHLCDQPTGLEIRMSIE
ncbi:hypothetical protein [Neobacillus jeddahensis]|uniref:hypothetical protein n=1 Tax=Neobacillus jeddahensis TaxID=1461580 RepID=UPI00058F85CA|nr:hypothetical protein [Neobacillus jeddahensis]